MEPKVRVEQVETQRGATPGRWKVTWRIENLGAQPLKILAARCPHGKFRCGEREMTPAAEVEPNQNARVELEVLCNESAGAVVENAFLILRVLWVAEPWLILARLRVAMDGAGTPMTTTELITAQLVGFSRTLSTE
jgi:hypothetical protein